MGNSVVHHLTRPGDTLVIHCSDPRFQLAFQCRLEEMRLEAPTRLIIPGGIYDLISPVQVKGGRQLWRQIKFLVYHLNLKNLVIFRHDDCLWSTVWGRLLPLGWDEAAALEQIQSRLKRLDLSVICERAELKQGRVTFTTA